MDQWLKVPSSLERILHGQHVQQLTNKCFLKRELHQVEGRQPHRFLTQFDALPLVHRKYVSPQQHQQAGEKADDDHARPGSGSGRRKSSGLLRFS